MGRPLILLAAGLGMTSRVFKSLGVPRIDGRSLVELGRLDRRTVLEDWFYKDFRIQEGAKNWINGILEETYGWPHHIISHVRACIVRMKEHGRTLTETGRLSMMEQKENCVPPTTSRERQDWKKRHA